MNYMDNIPMVEITQDEYRGLIQIRQKYELLIDNLYRRAKVYEGYKGKFNMSIDNAEEVLMLLDYERYSAKLKTLVAEYEEGKVEGNE